MGTQTEETPKTTEVDTKESKEGAKKSQEVKENKKKDRHHKNFAWIGPLDNALDQEKFEKDTNSKLKLFEAFAITNDTAERNFRKVVHEVIENEDIDTIVLQGGVREITNIEVNEAMMDTKRDIEEEKKHWFSQAENDSKELFKIAEDALNMKPRLKIVIIKRLPRFDRSKQDIIGIKSKISDFANSVLDQEWVKRGSPQNIHIVELNLVQGSRNLKSLIYGSPESDGVDGIHLRGPGAQRHFTYRAVQAVKKALSYPLRPAKYVLKTARKMREDYHATCPQTMYEKAQRLNQEENHATCPQAMYAKAQLNNYKTGGQEFGRKGKFYPSTGRPRPYPGYRTYSDAVKQGPTHNTVRGENIYNHLNF